MLLKAAINGARAPGEHPRLPLAPDDQAAQASESFAAGAGAVHAHARDRAGSESLAAADVAALTRAVRARCGSRPFGVSTGAWILPDPAERVAAIAGWTVLPDFASVNFSEQGCLDAAAAVLALGVGLEAGLGSEADAALLVESGLAPRCLRILLEPQDDTIESALENVVAMARRLDRLEPPRLLHGTGPTAWPLFDEAIRRGLDTRVGLEDMLLLPDGTAAADNADLVSAAVSRMRAARPLRESS
jgi:uncharacterized protein (DUF849 family)